MRFTGKVGFLQLSQPAGALQVHLHSDGTSVFDSWDRTTRMSPVFCIENEAFTSEDNFDFSGTSTLIFLGPVHPENVPALSQPKCVAWLTLGLFNVVVSTEDQTVAADMLKWADANKVPYETWEIDSGKVGGKTQSEKSRDCDEGWKKELGLSLIHI